MFLNPVTHRWGQYIPYVRGWQICWPVLWFIVSSLVLTIVWTWLNLFLFLSLQPTIFGTLPNERTLFDKRLVSCHSNFFAGLNDDSQGQGARVLSASKVKLLLIEVMRILINLKFPWIKTPKSSNRCPYYLEHAGSWIYPMKMVESEFNFYTNIFF